VIEFHVTNPLSVFICYAYKIGICNHSFWYRFQVLLWVFWLFYLYVCLWWFKVFNLWFAFDLDSICCFGFSYYFTFVWWLIVVCFLSGFQIVALGFLTSLLVFDKVFNMWFVRCILFLWLLLDDMVRYMWNCNLFGFMVYQF